MFGGGSARYAAFRKVHREKKEMLLNGSKGSFEGVAMVAGHACRDYCKFFVKPNRHFAY